MDTADKHVVIWGTDVHVNVCKRRFKSFLKKFHLSIEAAHVEGVDPFKPFYMQKLEEIHLLERPFLNVDCSHMKQIEPTLYQQLIFYPQEVIPIFDLAVNELFFSIYEEDTLPHQIQIRPYNVEMMKNMRCLDPEGELGSINEVGRCLLFNRYRQTSWSQWNDHSFFIDCS